MLKQTNISRDSLKDTLAQNLKDHVEVYDLAHEAWKNNYKKYVADFAKKIKKDDFKTQFDPPQEPTSYAKSYQNVIKQLEMSSDDIISLTSIEFQNYILDEWGFSAIFYSSFQKTVGSTAGLSASNLLKMSQYSE